jgi:hypothetical protein
MFMLWQQDAVHVSGHALCMFACIMKELRQHMAFQWLPWALLSTCVLLQQQLP